MMNHSLISTQLALCWHLWMAKHAAGVQQRDLQKEERSKKEKSR